MNNFNWKILNKSLKFKARTGIIETPNGQIKTPAFIFCATKGALKSISVEEANRCDTQIILSNTYHLMLQPGSKIIAEHGGIHNFMNWKKPILTDSGGFQIFSLGHGSVADEIKRKNSSNKNKSLLKIVEEGALFRSYIDGSNHLLTPEKSIEIQRDIGADLILVFDECTPFHVDKKYTEISMQRSHRWSKRSVNSFNHKSCFKPAHGSAGPQALYGIIQGGIYKDLRDESVDYNLKNNFFGLAIGGTLGSSKEEMYDVVNYTSNRLNEDSPVHLLGIGDPQDIWRLIKCGIDTFDCVSPTRLARHGAVLIKTKLGKLNIKNSIFKDDLSPLAEKCFCSTCNNYSKSYIHHLFKCNELLGFQLISIHNIYFMNHLMSTIRTAIDNDNLVKAEAEWYSD
ncbi:MAG: Queuine tRNA-ribosyltransferase [Alphaproteobacteria bacterium MarineAlpha5_Bin8]|nr:MAG: Queuine tRNA-ribosyltransferase [Alphaproteobacteria bacterium MarineAlpha5_Bin7]PPR46468.1 MAG: Queuine tRNA-ribosyltransferase [Alphaproteobacteria bacterium MarineAlpha5_Bin8]|tara:strand:+ start:1258 stop:2451 length:1194 start_codon:yes stop_codon:yes gene_type:complete